MKVWVKNYVITLLIFTLVLFTCIFVVIYTSFSTAINAERETAIHDEYHIARAIATDFAALETRGAASPKAISNVVQSYADYYLRDGIRMAMAGSTDVFFSNFADETLQTHRYENAVVCDIVTHNGSKFVRIADKLQQTQSDYWLVYAKDISDVYTSLNQRTVFLVALSFGVSVALAAGLYFALRRIYRPINNLAHELRTPLTAISGYAEYLQLAASTKEQRYNATKYIVDESRRLADITEKLLIIAGMREGGITHDKVDIGGIFAQAEMTFHRVAYTVDQQYFKGDAALLQSLVNNLVANAVKASSDDQDVTLTARDDVISVTDRGKGMSAAMAAKLSKPSSGYSSKDGSGLGLALCHQIAQLHGAALTFESVPGKETTARVSFTKRK